jgi:hypothetical protein
MWATMQKFRILSLSMPPSISERAAKREGGEDNLMNMNREGDPLQPHAHEPNPEPPSADPTFYLHTPEGEVRTITLETLHELPQTVVSNCYIISTGHGTSGPFSFSGVALRTFVDRFVSGHWTSVEAMSVDGFGNRVQRAELDAKNQARPIVLAYALDGRPMTREEGLVRMIVPGEVDDALRQVKWIGEIRVINQPRGESSAQPPAL